MYPSGGAKRHGRGASDADSILGLDFGAEAPDRLDAWRTRGPKTETTMRTATQVIEAWEAGSEAGKREMKKPRYRTVRCYHCAVVVVNNVIVHELGCPNAGQPQRGRRIG